MTLYAAIDLHSNNHYLCVIDGNDKRLFEAKFDYILRIYNART